MGYKKMDHAISGGREAMMNKFIGSMLCMLVYIQVFGQEHKLSGIVYESRTGNELIEATIYVSDLSIRTQTNEEGYYEMILKEGSHVVEVFSPGRTVIKKEILLDNDLELDFYLEDIYADLEEVEVNDSRNAIVGISRLRSVDGFGIYEAKKNELIFLDDFASNKVANNARQIFARVPGLNIWESDFAGLQLDIAARGLGPSRTANFNTRQNGYDMSADALGYPESYYMPAMQAVERIEIVRGAASLQYGTQFGGMLNFKIKEAPDKPLEVNVEQGIASYGLINSFVSLGGTSEDFDYYGYYQYRQGDGWRDNSGFGSHLAFSRLGYQLHENLKLNFEYSFLDYQAQQPGGLTDSDFEQGFLKESRRSRNWFRVQWNLLASTLDYRISDDTKLNVRTFGLISSRDALGNLEQIARPDDPNQNRTLISDRFENFGIESRFLHHFKWLNNISAVLVGARYYDGLTDRKQGDASASSTPEFSFINPENLENFDYDFPSQNYAFFIENILNLSEKFSLIPGVRLEYIRTDAEGQWKQIVRDFAGNIAAENTFFEDRSIRRSFLLTGLGASYYLNDNLNIYSNISENYRSVTFSDLRLSNPNFLLDSLITDERGYNADLGIRGSLLPWLSADISLFYLRYNDRIGVLLPPASTLLFRTNVGDSRHLGFESFLQADLLNLLQLPANESELSVFTNLSLIDATYIRSDDPSIRGREVEYVPGIMFRSGINYGWKDLKATWQYSYLGEQYADATNSTFNPNALTGIIPSYQVMDLSLEYTPGRYRITVGVNNLTDTKYFTRRAESYPGPGIIPATPRSFYVSAGIRI